VGAEIASALNAHGAQDAYSAILLSAISRRDAV